MKFEDLPKNYQDNINNTIKEWFGTENKTSIMAFKNSITEHLNNCEISEKDILDENEFTTEFLWYISGWDDRDKIKQIPLL